MTTIFDLDDDDTLSDRLSLKELAEKKQYIEDAKKTIYQKILKKIHNRIRKSDGLCGYVVPETLLGVVHYNQLECVEYIMKSLNKDGFYVRYTHPSFLLICWVI